MDPDLDLDLPQSPRSIHTYPPPRPPPSLGVPELLLGERGLSHEVVRELRAAVHERVHLLAAREAGLRAHT